MYWFTGVSYITIIPEFDFNTYHQHFQIWLLSKTLLAHYIKIIEVCFVLLDMTLTATQRSKVSSRSSLYILCIDLLENNSETSSRSIFTGVGNNIFMSMPCRNLQKYHIFWQYKQNLKKQCQLLFELLVVLSIGSVGYYYQVTILQQYLQGIFKSFQYLKLERIKSAISGESARNFLMS